MSRVRVSLLVAMTIMLVLGGLAVGQSDHASPRDPALLVGSWSVEATTDPGSPPIPPKSFAAFMRDGILINVNTTGHTAIGSWTKVGPRSYAVTFTGFEVIGADTIRYVVRSTLELSADSANIDGPFLTDLYAADGTQIGSASGTVHGERLTVLPLP